MREDDLYEITDAEDVAEQRRQQLHELTGGTHLPGRLTVNHLGPARRAGDPLVREVEQSCSRVRAAQKKEERLANDRDAVIREARLAGWSFSALIEMTGLSLPHLQRIARGARNEDQRSRPTRKDDDT